MIAKDPRCVALQSCQRTPTTADSLTHIIVFDVDNLDVSWVVSLSLNNVLAVSRNESSLEARPRGGVSGKIIDEPLFEIVQILLERWFCQSLGCNRGHEERDSGTNGRDTHGDIVGGIKQRRLVQALEMKMERRSWQT